LGEYTGGLDRNSVDQDGEFALRWSDDVTQVMFHVVTFMPNNPSDQHFTNKKRHIGNDYVHIVWSESNQPYDPETITVPIVFSLRWILCFIHTLLSHSLFYSRLFLSDRYIDYWSSLESVHFRFFGHLSTGIEILPR
jgi:hypothetical protein